MSPPANPAGPVEETAGRQAAGQERQRRIEAVKNMTSRQLEDALVDACTLDAEVGIPLRRQQGLCRVTLERLQLEIDDLAAIPEVRKAEEMLGRTDVLAKLLALRSKTPADKAAGLQQVLRDCDLARDDVELLGRLWAARARYAKCKQKEDAIRSSIRAHHDDIQSAGSGNFALPGVNIDDQIEEQFRLLRPAARSGTASSRSPRPQGLDKVLDQLVELHEAAGEKK